MGSHCSSRVSRLNQSAETRDPSPTHDGLGGVEAWRRRPSLASLRSLARFIRSSLPFSIPNSHATFFGTPPLAASTQCAALAIVFVRPDTLYPHCTGSRIPSLPVIALSGAELKGLSLCIADQRPLTSLPSPLCCTGEG